MSEHIHKNHNKSLLLYHLVCPIKYRRSVLSDSVESSLVQVCKSIESRYEIHFVEIGADENHVHFLIQSIPMLSVKYRSSCKKYYCKRAFSPSPGSKAKTLGR